MSVRSEFRKRRRALSDAEQRKHGAAVCRWLARSKLRLRRSPVAAYVAHDGEVVLNDFIRQSWAHGLRIALPVVRRRDMEFRTLGRNDQLAPNRYGIEEPVSGRRIPTRTLGAVLTPLVAFTAYVLVVDGGQAVMANALRGLQDVWIPCGIQLFTYLGLMGPVAYLLVFPGEQGAIGLLQGILIGSCVSVVLLAWRFYSLAQRTTIETTLS